MPSGSESESDSIFGFAGFFLLFFFFTLPASSLTGTGHLGSADLVPAEIDEDDALFLFALFRSSDALARRSDSASELQQMLSSKC